MSNLCLCSSSESKERADPVISGSLGTDDLSSVEAADYDGELVGFPETASLSPPALSSIIEPRTSRSSSREPARSQSQLRFASHSVDRIARSLSAKRPSAVFPTQSSRRRHPISVSSRGKRKRPSKFDNRKYQSATRVLKRARRPGDRYFVLKSNSETNLRTSQKENVWATQKKNEIILNEAFDVCVEFTQMTTPGLFCSISLLKV